MKVQLTAFKGMLLSHILDWPEESPMDIKLPLPLNVMKVSPLGYDKGGLVDVKPQMKVGTFTNTGHAGFKDNQIIHIYTLVDIS